MNIVSIKKENIHLLKTFIEHIGIAGETFRYFNKRSVEVINNHLITLVLLENDIPVGYGHLEPENDIFWLGICVLPAFSGKGYGKNMMNALIERAKELKLTSITLTVDRQNTVAIKLYEQFNFKIETVHKNYYKYVLTF